MLVCLGVALAVWSVVQALPGGAATPGGAVAAPGALRVSTAANAVSVVRITARTCRGTEVGSGFVAGDGLVVTAAHVVAGATDVQVELDGRTFGGSVLGADGGGRDVAVVAVAGLGDIARVGVHARALDRGDAVAAAGHPQGGPRQTLAGAAERYVDDGPLAADGGRVLTVSIAFEPGMSGGPVVDADGRVVGVAIGVERNSGTGIAVPVAAIGPTLRADGLVPARCGAGG